MEFKVQSNETTRHPAEPDVIWTAAGIAEVLNITPRQCWYLLERGNLPARKIGGKWVASRKALLNALLPIEEGRLDE